VSITRGPASTPAMPKSFARPRAPGARARHTCMTGTAGRVITDAAAPGAISTESVAKPSGPPRTTGGTSNESGLKSSLWTEIRLSVPLVRARAARKRAAPCRVKRTPRWIAAGDLDR
jgi:hypothetical protein